MDQEPLLTRRRGGGRAGEGCAEAVANTTQQRQPRSGAPPPPTPPRSSKRRRLATLAAFALALLALRVAARAAVRLKRHAGRGGGAAGEPGDQPAASLRLFTADELSRYTGGGDDSGGSGSDSDDGRQPRLYMAILGEVFDVSAKPEHYGRGGGYHHFVGGDGSRAFVTGEFAGARRDDLDGLPPDDVHSVVGWRKFYFETYPHKGRLIGRYYGPDGAATPALAAAEAAAAEGAALKAAREAEVKQYVECGAGWTAGAGGRVWCENGAYPRKLFDGMAGGAAAWRCVCMPDIGWSDLLQVYPDCAPDASECVVAPAGGAPE